MIITLFFACNLHIYIIPFVSVINCNVWFILQIYTSKMFNQNIDSIEVLLVFLRLLAHLNYFFGNILNIVLQNMNIWKIKDPSFVSG